MSKIKNPEPDRCIAKDQQELALLLVGCIREFISNEIDAKLDNFLKREEKELQDLFAKVKEEEAERIVLMLEGVKSHTKRIESMEHTLAELGEIFADELNRRDSHKEN
tara:strand:- start:178 stop:501 length:324 start_codon:yes stop_codon:yes gene_type:complete